MVVNIQQRLVDIGFTENEAKAYLALLKQSPATAYEIAKCAAIPTSKVYAVLEKLSARGTVLKIESAQKQRFVPIAPRELLATYRAKVDRTVDTLSVELAELSSADASAYIWNISERDPFLDKVHALIKGAHDYLILSLWPQEMVHLTSVLAEAYHRGVKVAIVHYGSAIEQVGTMFMHPIQDTIFSEKGGRGLIVVADGNECIVGRVLCDGSITGATSKNRTFISMTEDYLRHDIYIMKIVEQEKELLLKKFGENYQHLRDIFSKKVCL